ncbi:TPA: hypothetical protein QC443_004504 [Bacillus cereus]|nr:hypothetical protein [Bacillus cereus]HDR7825094.1 hypothetical protein [Bacillus anthracis]MBL3773840.1 hypothetical protein [Bacillus cereus]MBL3779685.1 hypothetical protein [Bacillus cereus]MBL3790953.1 hypothetical protein [Bacillus cereus]
MNGVPINEPIFQYVPFVVNSTEESLKIWNQVK